MNSLWLTSALVLAAASASTAGNRAVVEQLTRMEQQFAEAALRGDSTAIEGFLAEDFVGVDPGGQELSKAQVLADLKSPDRDLEVLRHENIRVRVFGECAVAVARTVVKGRYKGQPVEGEFPYMRVWVRRQGRWLAVATQSSATPR